jgi:hypothetical protein
VRFTSSVAKEMTVFHLKNIVFSWNKDGPLLYFVEKQDFSRTSKKTVLISTLCCENLEYFFFLYASTVICQIRINRNVLFTQVIVSFFVAFLMFGFPSLYATLMSVPCSQLEKFRAALLDIRQSHVITDHESGEDNYHHSERHTDSSEHVFQHMREQLNDCIRHHQNIKRYDHEWKCIQFECLSLFRKII